MRLLWLACLVCLTARADENPWSERVLEAINTVRAEQGLQPLRTSPSLQAIADGHSQRMATEGRVTHDGFRQRLERTSHRLCVENVAAGLLEPRALVAAWSRMPAHRANLLEPRARLAGVSAAGRYVTLFACD